MMVIVQEMGFTYTDNEGFSFCYVLNYSDECLNKVIMILKKVGVVEMDYKIKNIEDLYFKPTLKLHDGKSYANLLSIVVSKEEEKLRIFITLGADVFVPDHYFNVIDPDVKKAWYEKNKMILDKMIRDITRELNYLNLEFTFEEVVPSEFVRFTENGMIDRNK